MKPLDRLLQRWRIAKALPWIRQGDRLLDIGCFDPALLRRAQHRIERGVGIDPLASPQRWGNLEILRGQLPGEPRLTEGSVDCRAPPPRGARAPRWAGSFASPGLPYPSTPGSAGRSRGSAPASLRRAGA